MQSPYVHASHGSRHAGICLISSVPAFVHVPNIILCSVMSVVHFASYLCVVYFKTFYFYAPLYMNATFEELCSCTHRRNSVSLVAFDPTV